MGTLFHHITLIGPTGASETLDGMVDTDAMFTVIPAPILERLGVRPFRTMPVRFANGHVEQWQLGQLDAELDGTHMPILCLFGSPDAPPSPARTRSRRNCSPSMWWSASWCPKRRC